MVFVDGGHKLLHVDGHHLFRNPHLVLVLQNRRRDGCRGAPSFPPGGLDGGVGGVEIGKGDTDDTLPGAGVGIATVGRREERSEERYTGE